MLKIAIGTKSSYKINAIKRAIYNLDIPFDVEFNNAPSEISDQPMGKGETKLGSLNRAKNILQIYPDCDLGLGVEFGYELDEHGKHHMVCWASIMTKSGKTFSEQSSTLELPKPFKDAMEKNIDLDSILDSELKDLQNNETGRKFIEFIKKRTVIYECVNAVMLRYHFDDMLY
jgi:non-canonical (house-cleaning) NTP pyrophosphatase